MIKRTTGAVLIAAAIAVSAPAVASATPVAEGVVATATSCPQTFWGRFFGFWYAPALTIGCIGNR